MEKKSNKPSLRPATSEISTWTDHYFNRTKAISARFGDKKVTYAVFMRRPVIAATGLAVDWLKAICAQRKIDVEVAVSFPEGKWVGSGEPLLYISGSLVGLVDLETLLLQKLGPTCVAAYNAYTMCSDLPNVAFLAMDARHCAGIDMAEMMAYAAAVGSAAAQRKHKAIGFIGNATEATAHFFGQEHAFGTMPHAFIGYAGTTLRAAEMFHETFPDENLTVLVDYFGLEVTDSLAVCRRFPELAKNGRLAVRLDTVGSRHVEGLDATKSYAVLERNCPQAIRGYRTEAELRYLTGTGVSAAAIWHMRETLNKEGFDRVKIVGSSGFGPAKCRVMAAANAPLDIVGTGSFLPENWQETYATADIISYDSKPLVKVGREWLLRRPDF